MRDSIHLHAVKFIWCWHTFEQCLLFLPHQGVDNWQWTCWHSSKAVDLYLEDYHLESRKGYCPK